MGGNGRELFGAGGCCSMAMFDRGAAKVKKCGLQNWWELWLIVRYIYIYTCIYIYTYIYTYMNVYTCIHVYTHVYTCIHMYTHVWSCMYIYIFTYIYTLTYLFMYVSYIYIYTCGTKAILSSIMDPKKVSLSLVSCYYFLGSMMLNEHVYLF